MTAADLPQGRRRHALALRAIVVAAVVFLIAACSTLQSRGPDWKQSCERNATEGCPCTHDNACNTLWCVNGECERRDD
jgi:hypothetical protein